MKFVHKMYSCDVNLFGYSGAKREGIISFVELTGSFFPLKIKLIFV